MALPDHHVEKESHSKKPLWVQVCVYIYALLCLGGSLVSLALNFNGTGITALTIIPIIFIALPFVLGCVSLLIFSGKPKALVLGVVASTMFLLGCILLPAVYARSATQFIFGYFSGDPTTLLMMSASKVATLSILGAGIVSIAGVVLSRSKTHSGTYLGRLVFVLLPALILMYSVFGVIYKYNSDDLSINEGTRFGALLDGDLGVNHHTENYLMRCLESEVSEVPFIQYHNSLGMNLNFYARGCMAKHLESKRRIKQLVTTEDFLKYCANLPRETLIVTDRTVQSEDKNMTITYFDLCVKEYFWTIEGRDGTDPRIRDFMRGTIVGNHTNES